MDTPDAPLRVGLSASLFHPDKARKIYRGKTLSYGEGEFCHHVATAGGLPYILPALAGTIGVRTLRSMIGELDALILTGGADISPQSYGEEPLRPEWSGDPIRDRYERVLFDAASASSTPILAVCRGHQLVNVAMGGTLYQDLKAQRPGSVIHRDDVLYDDTLHRVRLAAGSWIRRVYGDAETLVVNSVHHQGIRALAPGLRATAWAEDGLIEAYETDDDSRLLYGVQWHPEWLGDEHPKSAARSRGQTIFAAFFADVRADICATVDTD